MKKFWTVLRDNPVSKPQYITKRHETLQYARMEAERLCIKERVKFIVLESIEYVGPPEMPLEWGSRFEDNG